MPVHVHEISPGLDYIIHTENEPELVVLTVDFDSWRVTSQVLPPDAVVNIQERLDRIARSIPPDHRRPCAEGAIRAAVAFGRIHTHGRGGFLRYVDGIARYVFVGLASEDHVAVSIPHSILPPLRNAATSRRIVDRWSPFSDFAGKGGGTYFVAGSGRDNNTDEALAEWFGIDGRVVSIRFAVVQNTLSAPATAVIRRDREDTELAATIPAGFVGRVEAVAAETHATEFNNAALSVKLVVPGGPNTRVWIVNGTIEIEE